jgi:hypothetical protein
MGLLSALFNSDSNSGGAWKNPDSPTIPQSTQQAPPSDLSHVMNYAGPLNRALATRPSQIPLYQSGEKSLPSFLKPMDYENMGMQQQDLRTIPGRSNEEVQSPMAPENQKNPFQMAYGRMWDDDDYRMKVLQNAPPEIIAQSIAQANSNPHSITKLSKANPLVDQMINSNVTDFYKNNMIGGISSKYESGGKTDIISSGKGDPGGASYGPYQLASKTGTLTSFIKQSPYSEQLAGLKPGTSEFNNKWKELSKDTDFIEAQHNFISQKNYQPLKSFATKLGVPDSRPINEALWSMGVQHGGAAKIVNKAVNTFKGDINTDQKGFVTHLYNTRNQYVNNLGGLSGGMKSSISNRYKNELNDVLKLYDS